MNWYGDALALDFIPIITYLTLPGVKNADENELLSIASEPANTHVYNVADFNIMSSIVEGLTKTVCEQVEQQDKEIKLSKQTMRRERETVKRSWMQNILDKPFNVLTCELEK